MPRPTFPEVYEEYFPFVWSSARRLGAPLSSLDDVVQETFVIAHRRLADFEERSTFKTWLFGILVNVVRAHRRSPHGMAASFETDVELDVVSDPAAGPLERATAAEAASIVRRLLDGLDEERRAVFVLAELEQMDGPDIARALGVPLNTVYSRLRLARQDFAAASARYRARDERRGR